MNRRYDRRSLSWCALATQVACLQPEAASPPPQPPEALGALWDLNGQLLAGGLRPPLDRLTITDELELQVSYFGCAQEEVLGTPATEQGCRPQTQLGYRFEGSDQGWAAIDPTEPVQGCDCAELDPYVIREAQAELRPMEQLRGGTVVPGPGRLPDVVFAVSDGVSTRHLRVVGDAGIEGSSAVISTSTVGDHSAALWADANGTLWSVGGAGLFRADLGSTPLQWVRSPLPLSERRNLSRRDAHIAALSLDPPQLLVVDASGLVLRWDRSTVEVLQSARPRGNGDFVGDSADLAPLYENGELRGFVLIGAATPLLPIDDDYQNSGYVLYLGGQLQPAVELPLVQSIAADPRLGTFAIDSRGGVFRLTRSGPVLQAEIGILATPHRFRVFDGHFVLVADQTAVVHYTDPFKGCAGRGNVFGDTHDVIPVGEVLVEIGARGQVRWSRARSICKLNAP